MRQIYIKRLTKQDITKSVAVCTESVDSFWGISSDAEDEYHPIHICHIDRPNDYPEGITIHKGYNGEKDWRICGNQWKKLYKDDDAQVGDLMLVKRINQDHFAIEIIKSGTDKYNSLINLFDGTDNYVLISNDDRIDSFNDSLPLQQIFYGAPGTGKSHVVNETIKGCSVIRTTFHPDSDYSTFVGSYKPSMEEAEVRVVPVVVNNGISLDQNSGTYKENKIVYKYVKQAFLKAYLLAWKKMTQAKVVAVAATDTTFTSGSSVYNVVGVDTNTITVTTATTAAGNESDTPNLNEADTKKISLNDLRGLYNNSDLEIDAVYKGIIDVLKELNFDDFDEAVGKLKNKVDQKQNFIESQFLIIEEINRGNCAQIFGDLFQLLDRQQTNGYSKYPIEADTDIQKAIEKAFKDEEPYKLTSDIDVEGVVENYTSNYGATLSKDIQEGRIILLPPNLYIWATMNTSDQSLFPIDSAFKRRWDWYYMPICKGRDKDGKEMNWAISAGNNMYDWWSFVNIINDKIGSITYSEDKKLGFFFCQAVNGKISAETFVNKVMFYLWNDVFKDYMDDPIFRDTDGNELSFIKFFSIDNNGKTKILDDKVVLFLTNLGVEGWTDVIDDASGSAFSFNGTPNLSLRDIAKNVVLNYANSNPSLNAQNVRDYFVNLFNGAGIAHIVETEPEYHLRDGQASQARTVSEITIPSGEKLYVSTQLRAKNADDNFMKFMNIVNSNDLGQITKV